MVCARRMDILSASWIGSPGPGSEALLIRSDLNGASLSNANLIGVGLTDAKFEDAELKGANFFLVDLQGVTFEPKSNPEIRSIATAQHLEFVT